MTDFHRLHLQLAVPAGSEEECRRFWAGILGCTEIEKPPALARLGGCWFRSGSVEIHLGVDADFRPSAKAHPGIVVPDISSLAASLEANAVPLRERPRDRRAAEHALR